MDWLTAFRDMYKPFLKEKYDEFEAALQMEKSRHIRINQSRGVDYLTELARFRPEIVNGFDGVYKVNDSSDKLTDTISFQTGGIYIMNPSSVVPAKILSSFMPEEPLILDVSAAPGGKTCALSDFTGRRGLIVANEISSVRSKSLNFNLEKYGCLNVKTISWDGRLLSKTFENTFDGVLLDAPCSNENKIFRNKTIQKNWGLDLIEKMASIQRPLILSAFNCLRSGGFLVYSTCTMNVEENENMVKFLLNERYNANLIQIDGFSGGGFSGNNEIDDKVIRIMPSANTMDGFFVAVFQKNGELKGHIPKAKFKPTDAQTQFFTDIFGESLQNIQIYEYGGRGYLEPAYDIFHKIPFKKRGFNIYRAAGHTLEASCQFIWEKGSLIPYKKRTNISYKDSIDYLKGFDIQKPYQYNTNALFSGVLPVGWGKPVADNIKNKLDRYFLFGKNIEW